MDFFVFISSAESRSRSSSLYWEKKKKKAEVAWTLLLGCVDLGKPNGEREMTWVSKYRGWLVGRQMNR